MNYGFANLFHFFKDFRSSRKVSKQNSVKVLYLDDCSNLLTLEGFFSASLDSVEVEALGKNIFLNNKGTYYDPEKQQKVIISSYAHATALRPDQESQDYLTGEQVEGILKAGLFDRVVRPNMTLAVIGFVLGIAVTGFVVATVLTLGMIL
jgi:hypothetical protein